MSNQVPDTEEQRKPLALFEMNKAAHAAVREAIKHNRENVDALKRIARETDDMVDAA